ncbi:hypothetical protein GCM10022243_50810 [Saccharothrix violaceirubra]|uniref:Putative membrane protein n=1 Tax=Saccharothrix violaceirubra TaxID=413306 RepID=A0A7W7SZ05_9PSEU|nr:hypothetical protein [Saccharothrix violaceirubra]MBB4963577.1 putative membrane protein [Saccharothrix violaceirubra]
MSQDDVEWSHETVVKRLASEMFRGALVATLVTVGVCLVVWTVVEGLPGLLAALVGGLVACLSSIATLVLMRKTAALPVQFIMVAALGGFMGKLIMLVLVMFLLRKFPVLHVNALGITMAATILVATFMEVRASKRSRSQMVVPTPGGA